MGNNYVYGYSGPPFNFLGHFCQSQQAAFNSWVNARTGNFPATQTFFQIRAAQLRRTAGVLEKFYSTLNDEKLAPTFVKATWQPGSNGWFGYTWRDDHLPMIAMADIKDYLQEPLQRQDEGVFQMNHIRTLIERQEDNAQKASISANRISELLTKITGYFSKQEYQAVLIEDQTDVYPAGSSQPRYRVHQFDVPTQYEQEQFARVAPGGTVQLKQTIQQ
jgi:hypothetical protein